MGVCLVVILFWRLSKFDQAGLSGQQRLLVPCRHDPNVLIMFSIMQQRRTGFKSCTGRGGYPVTVFPNQLKKIPASYSEPVYSVGCTPLPRSLVVARVKCSYFSRLISAFNGAGCRRRSRGVFRWPRCVRVEALSVLVIRYVWNIHKYVHQGPVDVVVVTPDLVFFDEALFRQLFQIFGGCQS